MAEKFRKIVAMPELAAKKLREMLGDMQPGEYVAAARRKQESGAITDKHSRAKDAAAVGVLGGLKWSAWLVAGGAQFLLWLARVAVMDNTALRKMEDKFSKMHVGRNKRGNPRAIQSFAKKYPNLSAHIIWYFALVATINGGIGISDVMQDDASKIKKEAKAYNPRMLNPMSGDFIDQCVALENITCIPLVYAETYRDTPKVQYGENVWTHGYGMTWSPDAAGHMTIRDYERDGKNADGTRRRAHKPAMRRTKDADINETQQFLKDHVYPKIQKNMTRELTVGEFYAICLAGYQLEGHISKICKQLSAAQTPQQIADAFITPSMYNYGGTPKRRWVCAMLAIGAITIDDILDADIDNFYLADQNTFIRNGHFVCDTNTIKYVMGLKRKKNTRAELMELADGRLGIEQARGYQQIRTIAIENSADQKKIADAMGGLIDAQKQFDAGNYIAAADSFERVISADPDNMEAYSSLAITYKKIGDMKKSIEYYEKSCDAVRKCNMRMNANKSLLMDYDVKAASYYNAGLAREAIADIYAARGDVAAARKNYELARRNFATARTNCQKGGASQTRLNLYDAAIGRVANHIKDKKVAFNSAQKTINKKSPYVHVGMACDDYTA